MDSLGLLISLLVLLPAAATARVWRLGGLAPSEHGGERGSAMPAVDDHQALADPAERGEAGG